MNRGMQGILNYFSTLYLKIKDIGILDSKFRLE